MFCEYGLGLLCKHHKSEVEYHGCENLQVRGNSEPRKKSLEDDMTGRVILSPKSVTKHF